MINDLEEMKKNLEYWFKMYLVNFDHYRYRNRLHCKNRLYFERFAMRHMTVGMRIWSSRIMSR